MGVVLRRRDPNRNIDRFYSLQLQADFLGGWALVREWGRAGEPGQVRVDPYPELALAESAGLRLQAQKRRRGYRTSREPGEQGVGGGSDERSL